MYLFPGNSLWTGSQWLADWQQSVGHHLLFKMCISQYHTCKKAEFRNQHCWSGHDSSWATSPFRLTDQKWLFQVNDVLAILLYYKSTGLWIDTKELQNIILRNICLLRLMFFRRQTTQVQTGSTIPHTLKWGRTFSPPLLRATVSQEHL